MSKMLKKNYHWIIAAVGLIQILIYGGVLNNFSAYHMIPVSETLGCSRTDFSLVCSVRGVVCVFSALLSGALLRHFSFRKTAAVGLFTVAGSFLLMAFAKNYWTFMVGYALSGIPDGICYTAGISRLVNRWFDKHRGLVLGMVTAASGVGSTLLGYVQSWAIDSHGWQMSFYIVAGSFATVAVLVALLIRDDPADMSLRPYGAGSTAQKKMAPITRWEGYSMEYLRKRPIFYLLMVCVFLTSTGVVLISYNVVPYLQDCGMEAATARRIYGYMMLFLGVIKLGMGALCDRIGSKRTIQLCHISCALGVLMLLLLPRKEWMMTAALLVYAISLPATTMMFPLLSVDLFGYRAQNSFIGIVVAVISASTVLASPVANAVYDISGSYTPVFWVSVGLEACLIGVYSLLFFLSKQEKEKLEKGNA